jgi:hypothetical protein
MSAAAVCASCGSPLTGSAEFCSECGARVGGADGADFKYVTVLFAN